MINHKSELKKISIFGSTGSIGKSAINVINKQQNNYTKYKVQTLVAQNNYKLLAQQALDLNPEYVVIAEEKHYKDLKLELSSLKNCQIMCGNDAVLEVAKIKCDLMLSAIVGIAGMLPTYLALESGSNIALANKEAIVCAGDFLINLAKKNNLKIFPVDSEHNAIFQIFEQQNIAQISDIVLTASGGPFFNSTKNFRDINLAEALKHPKWQMGNKISIDSATMMNKGLEMIEAYYFFPIGKDKIKIIVHPQSIIHGMVNYLDGASLAMMSNPDMAVPISYALNYPYRGSINHEKLDLAKLQKLEFYEVDNKKFPAIQLCKKALELEGSALVTLNCANEIAVEKFLKSKIRFDQIYKIVEETLQKIPQQKLNSVAEILDFNQKVCEVASSINT
jgi:1-deoxy-D-xylulose-5-phosphate reductoisomerase